MIRAEIKIDRQKARERFQRVLEKMKRRDLSGGKSLEEILGYCPKCGRDLISDFCHHCGEKN